MHLKELLWDMFPTHFQILFMLCTLL